MRKPLTIRATAIDLFCGAGGLTRGLLDAGVKVAAGYDIDDMCRFPYEYNNPGARFHHESVTTLTARDLARHYPKGHARILVGCAPCQTFSKYTQGLENHDDPKWTLLRHFARLIRKLKPDIVSMENVPDVVLVRKRVAVFIDGDFWHGWRLPAWEHKLSEFGKSKLRANRRRDQRNFRHLRATNRTVVRLWEHDIRSDSGRCIGRILRALSSAS